MLGVLAVPAPAQVVLSEIHFNPAAPTALEASLGFTDADDFEFLEIVNLGAATVSLQNCALLQGVTFAFGTSLIRSLAPGAKAVVVNNAGGFRARYPSVTAIAGAYSGSLNNSGETLAWRTPDGVTETIDYDDDSPWPAHADGKGWSLQRQNVNLSPAIPAAWRASVFRHGTPGGDDVAPLGVAINEILSHTDPPLLDYIELHNRSAGPIDIGGWWLSDDADVLGKYQIPAGTVLGRGAFRVITEAEFRSEALPVARRFGLDAAHGEKLYLSVTSGATVRMEDAVEFGGQFNGESFGRWPNGTGALHPQVARSPGESNGPPRVPQVCITEIQYKPIAPSTDWEFVEIANLDSLTVSLTSWRLHLGSDYGFPAGTQLAPGRMLLVVPFDPALPGNAPILAHFRDAWGMPADTPVMGVSSGRLSDVGEYVALSRPDDPPSTEPTFTPLVVEDLVAFWPFAPWPAATTGNSLHRQDRRTAGTRPEAWGGAEPSPGRLPAYDEDGDHIPDEWELRRFGSRTTANGSATDADGDRFPDGHEYWAGTDPLNAQSLLAVTQAVPDAAAVWLAWLPVTNVRYAVESATNVAGVWAPAVSAGGGGAGQFRAQATGARGYYRVRVETNAP